MADIKIDEAKAMAWVSDVKTEIDAVRLLLEEVRRSTENSVDSEDSILQMIRCVGEKMNDVWSNTCKAFKDGYDTLENGAEFPVTDEDILAIMRTISTVKAQNKYIMK